MNKIRLVNGSVISFVPSKDVIRGRCSHMLNFKNASGEIVMTEKDNGKLVIHDAALKESLEQEKRLEECKQENKEEK
jgi:hypothetical protein